MRKASLGIVLVFLVSIGAAMCPVVFTPPNSFVHLTTDSQGLLAYDEQQNQEKLVVRQTYEGVASDFGLVLPTPSEPELTKRSDKLFEKLHEMTKEPVDRNRGGFLAQSSISNAAMEDVKVVKKEQVGDFNATVLKAENATSLKQWLNENGFNYGERSEENFKYYVNQKGEYYFTALKVNVRRANCLTKQEFQMAKNPRFRELIPDDGNTDSDTTEGRCWLRGGLKPVEFRFESDQPILPIRIMAKPHDESPMTDTHENHDHNHERDNSGLPPGNYLVYTLSDQPLTIPGAKVKYSQKIGSREGPLSNYDTDGKFLVRQRIKFNAHKVEHDLEFKEAKSFFVSRNMEKVINPDQRDIENGMMKFKNVEPKYISFGESSILDRLSYEFSKISNSLHNLANVVYENTLILPLALLAILVEAPFFGLLLLAPIITGVFWSKGEAARNTFYSSYLITVITPIILGLVISISEGSLSSYKVSESFQLSGIAILAGLPIAAGLSLFSVISNYISSRKYKVRQINSRMEAINRRKALKTLTISGIAASAISSFTVVFNILSLDTIVGWTIIISSYPLSMLAGSAFLYRKSNTEDTDRSSWKKFTRNCIIILVISAIILGFMIENTATLV
jgi:hypothetical protein